jgi:hypothetical protein
LFLQCEQGTRLARPLRQEPGFVSAYRFSALSIAVQMFVRVRDVSIKVLREWP